MFMQNLRAYLFQDEAGDGTGAGEGGGGGDSGDSGESAALDKGSAGSEGEGGTPADQAASKTETALSKNASTEDPFHGTPEKYRVMREDGSLDEQATLAKTATAYNDLSKKMGQADGVAPAAPGDYEINMPGEMGKEFDQEDPGFKEFLTNAHAAGFTQKQLDTTMEAFGKTIGKLTGDIAILNEQECNAQLEEVWKTPDERAANYQAAFRAFESFSGERFDQMHAKYGNDPDMIWMMAEVGKQMKEGSPPPNGDDPVNTGGVSMTELVRDLGSKDKAVREKAQAAWSNLYGQPEKQ